MGLKGSSWYLALVFAFALSGCLGMQAKVNETNSAFEKESGTSLTFVVRGLYSTQSEYKDANVNKIFNEVLAGKVDFLYEKGTNLVCAIVQTEPRTTIRVGPIPDGTDSYGRNIYLVGVLSALANLDAYRIAAPNTQTPMTRMYQVIQMYVDSGYDTNLYNNPIIEEGLRALKGDVESWARGHYHVGGDSIERID